MLWLILGLAGFAIAAPFYDVLLRTPDFLVVRQSNRGDVWLLAMLVSVVMPVILVAPAWVLGRAKRRASQLWVLLVAVILVTLLATQFLPKQVAAPLFLGAALLIGVAGGFALVFTRWKILGGLLAILALFFPLRLLWIMPVQQDASVEPAAQVHFPDHQGLPNIVFLVLDELPIATLIDDQQEIDASLYPAFHRLRQMSDWYVDTISVSDGTVDAVPAIVEGRYPSIRTPGGARAVQPSNLFTLLAGPYRFNVRETVSSLCPRSLCRRQRGSSLGRLILLSSDLFAVYLHEVSPEAWVEHLPDVTSNWGGFFTGGQLAVTRNWRQNARQQTVADRPAILRAFIQSIDKAQRPTLNFLHILFPHAPFAYLPGGKNYGLESIRGKIKDRWAQHQWSIASARQRHVLQVQFADELLGQLLDRLVQLHLLESSLLVVVADHGLSFLPGDTRRTLSSINAQSLLRVPLFIKAPGQNQGRRIEQAAMTIDILPTVLGSLGIEAHKLALDGIDFNAINGDSLRVRRANSYADPVLRELSEAQLDISAISQEGRRQLRLDVADAALWNIGPHDDLRGRPLDALCTRVEKRLRFRTRPSKALPNTHPEDFLPAFVAGRVSGRDLPDESLPFVVTANQKILASGMTWKRDANWFYYTLLQPKWVTGPEFSPQVALVVGAECWAGKESP